MNPIRLGIHRRQWLVSHGRVDPRIEGPALSTRAGPSWYLSLGGFVVGMTNMPEARLAREAEIGYATLAPGRARATLPVTR
jgi:purine nucleoside phosphorylase